MATQKHHLEFLLAGKMKINRLGYGAMQLTGPGVFGDAPNRSNAITLLQAAVKNGINFIDTANAYGPKTNEILIAEALYPYPKELVIATKGGLDRPGPNQWVPNGDPLHIKQAIEDSLMRLRVEQIDLWQLHRVDPNYPIEETLRPVADAVAAGKIKYVGLSEVDVDQIERAEKVVPIVSVQNLYNLNDRHWDALVDYTYKRGMAFIPWFPLASGPDKIAGSIKMIAAKYGVSTAQIALAWLLKRSPNIILIPGTSSMDHLFENIQAIHVELSDEEFSEISQ
jgi:aryl-alcohol dehydrogenase-like predicted oxidoreductase